MTRKKENVLNFSESHPNWSELLIVVGLYILACIFVMAANPFQGETVAPVSLLSKYAGWSSHDFISPSSHHERSDALDAFIPQWITLKKQIQNGGNGVWNPLAGGGRPGLLDFTRGLLTPSFLIFFLFEHHWLGYYFAGLIKLVLACVGIHLFLRHFIGVRAAFWGGLAFALCGFNVAWFHWPHVCTAAWIPWLLWASAGWCHYRSSRWIFAVSLATVALILGGFPAVAAYGFYAATLFVALMALVYSRSLREYIYVSAGWALPVATGFFLTSVPLLALNETLSLIDLSYRHGGTSFQFPKDLVLLVNAFAQGLPRVERTVSVGFVACGFSLISCMRLRNRVANDPGLILVVYGMVLFGISFVISFGMLPHSFLRAIPAIGSSPWNRLSIIVGLSLVLLAAAGLDFLLKIANQRRKLWQRRIIFLAVILCVLVQFAGQVKLFRKFNGLAYAVDFLPKTPALEYVSKSLTPTQSVIADNSYLISGTLGSYGIGEWFAHGFKTNAEKTTLNRLIDRPFLTPTAASFPSSAIRPNADLYARLGIRYVLQKNIPYEVIRKQEHRNNLPAPSMPENSLSQVVNLEQQTSVAAVGMMLATYHAPHAPADVVLTLKNEAGELLGSTHLDATEITDNRNAIFRFKNPINLRPGAYQLDIKLATVPEGGNLTAWYSKDISHKGDYLYFNDVKQSGSFLYTLYKNSNTRYLPSEWKLITEIDNGKVLLYGNLLTPEGAYFLTELKEDVIWSDKKVVTIKKQADSVHVRYNGNKKGHIVIPMRFYPGWKVYVNGEKQEVFRYLGMLPAIEVDGASIIDYVYKPSWLFRGTVLTVFGLSGLIILFFLWPVLPKFLKNKELIYETNHSNSLPE